MYVTYMLISSVQMNGKVNIFPTPKFVFILAYRYLVYHFATVEEDSTLASNMTIPKNVLHCNLKVLVLLQKIPLSTFIISVILLKY